MDKLYIFGNIVYPPKNADQALLECSKMVSFQDVTKGLNSFLIKQVYLPD